MIDPNDPGTMDLVEACKRPLNGAERARRHREKAKREREAGQRAALELKAPELAVLSVALAEFRERWQRVPSKLQAVDALLPRVPQVPLVEAFPGDSAWLPDACQQQGAYPDYVAQSAYNVDVSRCHSPQVFRQTPYGQPEVDALVAPGDKVWTSYGSGPYLVKRVIPAEWRGMRCFTLELADADGGNGQGWINELVAVDGRLLKLFGNSVDQVFVASRVLADGYVEDDELDAIRGVMQWERSRLESIGREPTFEALAFGLLSFNDQQLLQWARRNTKAVRETPADQAYPQDPELRNVLGAKIIELKDLQSHYQMLLSVAMELYELVDLSQHTPRLSTPAGFLRQYKRESESYQGAVSREPEGWPKQRFAKFGKRPVQPSAWQVRAEKAEAELAHIRDELAQLGQEVGDRRRSGE